MLRPQTMYYAFMVFEVSQTHVLVDLQSNNPEIIMLFLIYLFFLYLFTCRCIDSKSRPNLLEKILLLLGALMFFACAGLILASLEQILPDLYDNAILLGTLSVIVGVLYLIDLADPLSRKVPSMTQTDSQMSTTMSSLQAMKLHRDAQTSTESYPPTPQMQQRESHLPAAMAHDTIDFIKVKQYPEKQSPKFATIRESRLIHQGDLPNNGVVTATKEYREPWEEFEPSIVSKPPSIRSSRAPTQSPDFGYQSASYVAAPPVDRGNLVIKKARPMMYHYYPDYSAEPVVTQTTTTESIENAATEQHEQPQIKRGYVANAARLWDSRMSKSSPQQSNNHHHHQQQQQHQPNSMNTIV